MRILSLQILVIVCAVSASCSPRDFLTRRLAADLIATSSVFRAAQPLEVRTGVLSNDEYLSPESLALRHRGWISAAQVRCPQGISPAPCWDTVLSPAGVDTFQTLIAPGDTEKKSFRIAAARREIVTITGIAKHGKDADVEFTWRWIPLNEAGAVFYSGETRYSSSVSFRKYDDGWRVVETARSGTPLDEALKNSTAGN
jgi:hypothetical protein